MKKIIIAIALFLCIVLIFFVGWKSGILIENNKKYNNENVKQSNCMELYKAYIKGNQSVSVGNKTYTINDMVYEYASTLEEIKYAFFDMNGDGNPELHIRTSRFYIILTCKKEELVFWCEESVYSTPLNNRAMLYIRSGGAPEHISYEYKIFDFYGNIAEQISFEKYDDNEDGSFGENDLYLFSDVQISKIAWDELTKKYLSISSDQIQWLDYFNE